MSDTDYNPHSGADGLSVSGMVNTGSIQAASSSFEEEIVIVDGKPVKKLVKKSTSGFHPDLVAASKRQSYLKDNPNAQKRFMDTTSYLAMIQAMGNDKLYKPFVNAQVDDLRNDNRPDGRHSAALIWAMIAGAKFLPYASDLQMQLWAQNINEVPKPVESRLDLDAA